MGVPLCQQDQGQGQLLSAGTEKDAGLGGLGSCTLHHGGEGELGPLCRVWALKVGRDSKISKSLWTSCSGQAALDQSLETCC